MKVYIVWRMEAELPFSHHYLEQIFAEKEKADLWCQHLKDTNDKPLEEDDYGPIHGQDYHVTEAEAME